MFKKPVRLVLVTAFFAMTVTLIAPISAEAEIVAHATSHAGAAGVSEVFLEGSGKSVVFDPSSLTVTADSVSQCQTEGTNLEIRNDSSSEQRLSWSRRGKEPGKAILGNKATDPLCFSTAGRYKFDLKSNTTAQLILIVKAAGS
jgi:plastocyanin